MGTSTVWISLYLDQSNLDSRTPNLRGYSLVRPREHFNKKGFFSATSATAWGATFFLAVEWISGLLNWSMGSWLMQGMAVVAVFLAIYMSCYFIFLRELSNGMEK